MTRAQAAEWTICGLAGVILGMILHGHPIWVLVGSCILAAVVIIATVRAIAARLP